MSDAAPALEIRLLGQASVVAAGAPVKFAKRLTTLAMLAFVVLRRGRPVARDSLAYMLFPDQDEQSGMAELRRYLYLASKALPPREGAPWLLVEEETVAWNSGNGEFVDAIEFERFATDPATQDNAVDLYTGDLLEEIYDDWVVAERERLRVLNLQALNDLVARHRATRNHEAALAYAQRLLASDPWREDVVRQAMAIQYASGDAYGALAEYDRFAARLDESMAISPMPETLALRAAILRGEPIIGSVDSALETRARPARGRSLRVLPFVGRENERAIIQAQWDRAAYGMGSVIMLSGEEGVGKTRLLGELARVAEAQGARVYTGTTSSPEAMPYQCVVEALRAAQPLLTSQSIDSLSLGVLAGVLPELRGYVSELPDVAALSAERESARLFDSLATAVKSLASPRPLLLIFEDLHWAADATIEAIAAIARRIDRSRVLIVATYREEDVPASHAVRRLAHALGAEGRTTEVHLERLSSADVAGLVSQLDELSGRGAPLVERLYAFSEGNALFLNEAIAHALETRDDPIEGKSLVGIGNLVAARTSRLRDDARGVAEIVAVCGEGCNFDVVRDVIGLSAAETLDAFNELLDRHLVREAAASERFDYIFTHHLIGASIYDRMDNELRVTHHASIARALEQKAPQRPEFTRELARHYDLAGMSTQAGRWYARAAHEAAAVYAHDDAVRLATMAVDRLHDPALTVDALLVREAANARLGNREAQVRDLDLLDWLAESPDVRCRVLERRIALLRSSEDRRAERNAIEALRRQAASIDDPVWQGRAASALGALPGGNRGVSGCKERRPRSDGALRNVGYGARSHRDDLVARRRRGVDRRSQRSRRPARSRAIDRKRCERPRDTRGDADAGLCCGGRMGAARSRALARPASGRGVPSDRRPPRGGAGSSQRRLDVDLSLAMGTRA